MISQEAAMGCTAHRFGEGPAGDAVVVQQGLVVGQHDAHVGKAARESLCASVSRDEGVKEHKYAQISEKPVDVEQRTPVRIAHARNGAVGVRS